MATALNPRTGAPYRVEAHGLVKALGLRSGNRPADRKGMVDQRPLYVPWYEASPEGLDELALIKRTVDLSQDGPDGLSR